MNDHQKRKNKFVERCEIIFALNERDKEMGVDRAQKQACFGHEKR